MARESITKKFFLIRTFKTHLAVIKLLLRNPKMLILK